MKKLIITAATAAVFCSGMALVAQAQDRSSDSYSASPVIGEKGARWGAQCWTDTSGGGYFGFWTACTPSRTASKR